MTDGRTLRAQAQRIETHGRIVEASLDVFATKGFHGASVKDLLTAADVSRGTFYAHFPRKTDVFLALIDRLIDELRASVVGVATHEGAPPMAEQLEATVTRVLETMRRRPALTKLILRESVGLDPEVDDRMDSFWLQLERYIQLALANGEYLGMIRKVDVEVTATCVLGAIRQIGATYLIQSDETPDLPRLARGIVDLHLRGLLPSD